MFSTREIIEQLNNSDECVNLEAKTGSAIDRSIMETICAFSNEPHLEGGYIILGVAPDETTLFPFYKVVGVSETDKLQSDLASRCASEFNIPIRPDIVVERFQGVNVLKIFVHELPPAQKPLYFKNLKLPDGAYRRIGPTDQRCTEDDLLIFYNHQDSYDGSILKNTTFDDVDENALEYYRTLREKANPQAEELNYNDIDLLISLGCAEKKKDSFNLTVAGLILFGKSIAQRRIMPMLRTDYIRVSGNEWVSNPDERFQSTLDMRGPVILLLSRTFNAISDDLPKGFLLPEGDLQAQQTGLPFRVLREALVNAFMHRSYKVQQPIQIIRYSNRIEITNPGFSLKPEDYLGEPGSKIRNQFIAAVFHDTLLAETKGSGISTMRKLMEQIGMASPTFESDHTKNQFIARLLLHHFLSEEHIEWLNKFEVFSLNQEQKKALIFVKEVGAINNPIYRQISATDILRASTDLRKLRELNLLEQKGKGRATYYVEGQGLIDNGAVYSDNNTTLIDDGRVLIDNGGELIDDGGELIDNGTLEHLMLKDVPSEIKEKIYNVGKRTNNKDQVENIIIELCLWKPLKLQEIAIIIGRSDNYIQNHFLFPMREKGLLEFTIPDMPKHPDQAYRTVKGE